MTASTPPRELRQFPDADALARAAAAEVAQVAGSAVRERGRFTIALAGGATPRRLYELLAEPKEPFRKAVPWAKTQIFFGDERFVAADRPDSNFRMVRLALLYAVVPLGAVAHPIPTSHPDPTACAATYAAAIRQALALGPTDVPRIDLVLLGLGTDGHTASLFPGCSALEERERLVAATWVERLQAHRITLTLPLINNARFVLFLVAGRDKAETLARVLGDEQTSAPLPAQRVRPTEGRLAFWVDDEAARLWAGR